MFYFLISLTALILGYFIYGSFVDKFFGSTDNEKTPANTLRDGVDFEPMPKYKVLLIQILNIAGVGPIFGPILGVLYGPIALVWIVIGSIFAGAVHDYLSGMLSIRNKGVTAPTYTVKYLGKWSSWPIRISTLLLLFFVGVAFIMAPARLLHGLFDNISVQIFILIIFAYYFLATILPVNKIIGKLYPIFGAMLIVMSVLLLVALGFSEHEFYAIANDGFFTSYHPNDLPIWPLMFITIACGAISGFHSTQSSIMARCLENENSGKMIFYGGMIAEGAIALIWATLAMSFYPTVEALFEATSTQSPAGVVSGISFGLLGGIGGTLAVIAIIILPITSGDTAFRSIRLTLSEIFSIGQSKVIQRLAIAIPLFIIAFFMTKNDFDVIWRYLGVTNQLLASIMLWTGAAYFASKGKSHLMASLPATFMSAICITYLAMNKQLGFGIEYVTSTYIGIIGAVALFIAFVYFYVKKPNL
ncbi:MAG: carbon starvation protein A [Sulfurospirillum sp.]|nr:carbon starvation protein A [Sulfurospirillum sp.]